MIFLDTSFLISFYNEKDENHARAWEIMHSLIEGKYSDVCISDYIFDECATVIFMRLKDLEKTIVICEAIKKVTSYDIEKEVFDQAWEIFKNQKNTKFSFTDCTIIALMKEKGIKKLATFDKDFKKVKEIKVIE